MEIFLLFLGCLAIGGIIVSVRNGREGDGVLPPAVEPIELATRAIASAHSQLEPQATQQGGVDPKALADSLYRSVMARHHAFEAFLDQRIDELGEDYFFSKVVGVTYRNADGTRRQVLIGELEVMNELFLVPEPECRYDPNAIRVETAFSEQIGYLERRLAGETSRAMAKGVEFRCFVSEITGWDRPTSGVNIVLFRIWPPVHVVSEPAS